MPIADLTDSHRQWAGRARAGVSESAGVEVAQAAQITQATILFFDVAQSMTLSARLPLEEWWTMLGSLVDLMSEGVERFDGWVANFTGDGICAVFEGDGRAGSHAVRACRAARWLYAALAGAEVEIGRQVSLRAGIHTGRVAVGALGRRRHARFTTTGYEVGLAKRIESLAGPGEVFLSAQAAAAVAAVTAGAPGRPGARQGRPVRDRCLPAGARRSSHSFPWPRVMRIAAARKAGGGG